MGKQLHVVAMVVSLLLGVVACDQPAPPLRVGTNVWPGYEPLYLARELGYFGDAPVRLVEFSSATQVIQALHHNTIELAALTLDEFLLARAQGIKSKVLLVLDISHGADVVVARPPLKSLAELKGKRIGLEDTALGSYVLSRALEHAGLMPADVTVVAMQVDAHEAAYLDRRVDAVVTFDPVASRLLNAGAVLLFNSAQIPNEIVDVLVTGNNVGAEHTSSLNAVIDAWFRAVTDLRERPAFAAQYFSKRLRLSPDDTLKTYSRLRLPTRDENRELLIGNPPRLDQIAQRLLRQMKQRNLIASGIDFDTVVDANPLLATSAPR